MHGVFSGDFSAPHVVLLWVLDPLPFACGFAMVDLGDFCYFWVSKAAGVEHRRGARELFAEVAAHDDLIRRIEAKVRPASPVPSSFCAY